MNTSSFKHQRGLTLIELMVALLLSLFLLGGLYSLFDSNSITYQDNQELTQLVDSERFALTVVSEVTELAGYFPDPTTQSASTEFTADALFPAAAVSVAGTSGGATGDTLAIRFVTAPKDGLLNCNGVENTGSTDTLYENVFSVNNQNELVCSLNGATPEVLVNNVQSMTVEYGVQTTPDSSTTNFDTYKTAAEMSSQDWVNVACVKVTLNFLNPMAKDPGQPATISVTRVIDVMAYSPLTAAVPVASSNSSSSSTNNSNSNNSKSSSQTGQGGKGNGDSGGDGGD